MSVFFRVQKANQNSTFRGHSVCLALGHAYMIMLVMLVQTLVYREVTALFSIGAPKSKKDDDDEHNGRDPWSKTLNWYFFVVTNFFLYGESIIYYFKVGI